MINWEKVRDAIINSDICDVEEGISIYKELTYVHSSTRVIDILEVVREEIENQLNNPEEKHFYGGL